MLAFARLAQEVPVQFSTPVAQNHAALEITSRYCTTGSSFDVSTSLLHSPFWFTLVELKPQLRITTSNQHHVSLSTNYECKQVFFFPQIPSTIQTQEFLFFPVKKYTC